MVYLDNASICKPSKKVIEAVTDVLKNNWYNASSVNYDKGRESNRIVENTRKLIADTINCTPDEIIFCTSGSEANSLAMSILWNWSSRYYDEKIYCSNAEHDSILNHRAVKSEIRYTPAGFASIVDVSKINNAPISVMFAQNEVGNINDIQSMAYVAHKNGCIIHSDCTGAFGHIKIDVNELGLDLMSVAMQKLSGVTGCAFLYINKDMKEYLTPIVYGSQNNNVQGGTYNVVAIKAANVAISDINYTKEIELLYKRNYLIDELLKNNDITLNGDRMRRLSNNVNFCVHNVSVDNIQMIALLDLKGYMVSGGSACSSGENTPSHVLKAIGLSDEDARHSLRVTLSYDNTFDELDGFIKEINQIIEQFHI